MEFSNCSQRMCVAANWRCDDARRLFVKREPPERPRTAAAAADDIYAILEE